MTASIEKIKKKIRSLTDEVDEWHDKADLFERLAREHKERAEAAEAEAAAVHNKLILCESDADKAEARSAELTEKVAEYEKQIDEQEQWVHHAPLSMYSVVKKECDLVAQKG